MAPYPIIELCLGLRTLETWRTTVIVGIIFGSYNDMRCVCAVRKTTQFLSILEMTKKIGYKWMLNG